MKEYTTLDWKTIGKELGNEIVGILKNQQLTERELIDGCKTIGKIYAPGLAVLGRSTSTIIASTTLSECRATVSLCYYHCQHPST